MALCSAGPSVRKRSIGFMLLVYVLEAEDTTLMWYGQSVTGSNDLCSGELVLPLYVS
jgi:hypothetical protein